MDYKSTINSNAIEQKINTNGLQFSLDNIKSIEELKIYLNYLQEVYNNTGQEIVSDETFDSLVTYYEKMSGLEYKVIGAKPRDKAEPLPRPAPSLDKAKGVSGKKDYQRFYDRYENDITYLDKLDGISLEIEWKVINGQIKINIWKRGDGELGPNVSHIANFLKLPPINFNFLIRGELCMSDKVFDSLNDYLLSSGKKAKNSRSVVNGATNKIDSDGVVISNCTFIAFFIYDYPNYSPMTIVQMLDIFKQLGFTTCSYITVPKSVASFEYGIRYLKERREKTEYRIDGVVAYFNIPLSYPTENENPNYAIAVKEDSMAITKVICNNWNLTSKDGYLTPVVMIEPVEILGSIVSYITMHNARMVIDNKVDKGAIIIVGLGGDVIPRFYETITPAPILYAPIIPTEWNERGVELRAINADQYVQVKCCKIKYFLSCLGVKKWGLITIWKLYHGGFTTIGKIIRTNIQQLMEADGVKYDGALGLYDELQKGIKKVTVPKIMAGSCIFGEGLGDGIAEKFITNFPNWKIATPSYEEILTKKDFGPARAKMFSTKLDQFKDWLNDHPELEGITIEKVRKNNMLQGYVFIFTGFTDNVANADIKSYGGIVKEKHWTNDVNVVVASNVNKKSDKSDKARESNGRIRLISREDLMRWLTQIRLNS